MTGPVHVSQSATGETHWPLRAAFDKQRRAFDLRHPPTYAERRDALEALLAAILQHETLLVQALEEDYGRRAPQETQLLEIFPIVNEVRFVLQRLRRWMRPERVPVQWQFWPGRAYILRRPLGVVGILGAWNYPLHLTLVPLVDALAAGNHAMIKPSELAPHAAETLRQLLAKVFSPEHVQVVLGGPDVAAQFASLPFDHLLFTGSGRIGKLVMRAAAENLTPVTLELGGKSPALVQEDFPIDEAADRICSAKFWNAGQTCVAPDYVFVPQARYKQFVEAARAVVEHRWPHPGSNPDYTHIIDCEHWKRLAALVEDARVKGARIHVVGADIGSCAAKERFFPPVLLTHVQDTMQAMQEEIFGPILPIVPYESLDSALEYIRGRDRPLALYYFDRDRARIRHVLERTIAGGVTINGCIFHLSEDHLPFGGVGASGMGSYHGLHGLDTFSKRTGTLAMDRTVGAVLGRLLGPPYGKWTDRAIRFLIGRSPGRGPDRLL
jgi:acyl-CoA reductase-like NAD-dependent aldehyde dehydrogenase